MSEQTVVELLDNGSPKITFNRAAAEEDEDGAVMVVLPTIESAEALRDALSSFLAFHKPRIEPRGELA